MIYLDNAATTYPKPPAVRLAVQEALMKYGANPGRGGYPMSEASSDTVYDCRKEIAEFIDAPGPESVVFTQNCTHGLNTVIKGLLKSGDHAVISSFEHNAVLRPLEKLKEKGIAYTAANVYPGDNDKTVDSFRQALKKNTRLIVCTHASNVFGIRLPVERIAALAHAYGIPILIDCAQSMGILPVDMKEYGFDYICAPGHKGLYGPMGTGFMAALDGTCLDTLTEGGTGTNSSERDMPSFLPERFESGTLNVPGIAGLLAGVRFVRAMGRERIRRYEAGLMEHLYSRLEKMKGIRLYTGSPDERYHIPVLSFNIGDIPCEDAADMLAKNGIAVRSGLHCAPLAHEYMDTAECGSVRAAPSIFTRRGEIDRFCDILSEINKKSYKTVDYK